MVQLLAFEFRCCHSRRHGHCRPTRSSKLRSDVGSTARADCDRCRIDRCNKLGQAQLNEIYEFITHTKINLHLGHIDQDTYQGSYLSAQLMIERLISEREDIEYALNTVATNLSVMPPEPLKSLPPSQPVLVPIKLQIREKDL